MGWLKQAWSLGEGR